MAYYHQNTHVNITILVVDDDPIFLSIIPSMLKNPRYKDKSVGEITVMTSKDSSEAVSTLRGQCNKIDFVITDYHMPGLNGVQLKRRIDEEFGNLPVIVISADMNNAIEHESLTSGAMCFMRKPIKSNDLNIIWKHALNSKMNDGSKKIQETNSTNNPNDGDSRPQATKKSKIKWTSSLNHLFLKAIEHIGLDKTVPKKILEFMNVKDLTREQVASKLQKYRNFLKKVKDKGIDVASRQMSRRGVNSNFASSSYINPQHSYNYNPSLRNNNAFKSHLSYGVGQSNFMMNNNASKSQLSYGVGQSNFMMNNNASKSQLSYGVGQSNFMMNNNASKSQLSYGVGQSNFRMNNNAGSHDSIHYMNRRPTYDLSQTGSDLMSMRKSFGVSNGMLPLKEKSVNIFGTSQDSQAPRFGQYGTTSNVLGMNSNLTTGYMGSNYVGIKLSGNGDLVAPSGIKVNGNGNSSLDENLGAMNWNSNDTNMSNHGSSTSKFPSALSSFIDNQNQPQSNFIAQTDGVVPVLENPSIFNDHHGINEGFNNTMNSQFDQHQNQGEMTGENFGVSTDDLLERNEIFAPFPLEDISNWSFNNDNYNDGTLNSIVTNSEMYFPTHALNITNQELGVGDSMELPLSFDKDWNDEDQAFLNCWLGNNMN